MARSSGRGGGGGWSRGGGGRGHGGWSGYRGGGWYGHEGYRGGWYGRGFYPYYGYGWGYGSPWLYGDYGYDSYPGDYYSGSYDANPGYYGNAYDYGPDTYTTGPSADYNYGSAYAPSDAESRGESPDAGRVLMNVRVPADAQIWVDGQKTSQTGSFRQFESPPLNPDREYTYHIRAQWRENGREVTRNRDLRVHAGDRLTVDLRHAAGTDQRPQPAYESLEVRPRNEAAPRTPAGTSAAPVSPGTERGIAPPNPDNTGSTPPPPAPSNRSRTPVP
jgi:uncharacterized protein (TIGR03000 family)